jgi:hypothetical protein
MLDDADKITATATKPKVDIEWTKKDPENAMGVAKKLEVEAHD